MLFNPDKRIDQINALPHGARNEVPHGARNEVPHGARSEVPHGARNEVPHGARSEVPHGARNEVPHGARNEVPHGARNEVPHGARNEVPHGARSEVPHGVRNEVPHGARSEVPHGVRNEVLNGAKKEIPQGIRNEIPHGVRSEVLHGVRNEVPNELTHVLQNEVQLSSIISGHYGIPNSSSVSGVSYGVSSTSITAEASHPKQNNSTFAGVSYGIPYGAQSSSIVTSPYGKLTHQNFVPDDGRSVLTKVTSSNYTPMMSFMPIALPSFQTQSASSVKAAGDAHHVTVVKPVPQSQESKAMLPSFGTALDPLHSSTKHAGTKHSKTSSNHQLQIKETNENWSSHQHQLNTSLSSDGHNRSSEETGSTHLGQERYYCKILIKLLFNLIILAYYRKTDSLPKLIACIMIFHVTVCHITNIWF